MKGKNENITSPVVVFSSSNSSHAAFLDFFFTNLLPFPGLPLGQPTSSSSVFCPNLPLSRKKIRLLAQFRVLNASLWKVQQSFVSHILRINITSLCSSLERGPEVDQKSNE